MRSASLDATQKLDEFVVGIDYRKDVYRSIKAYLDTNPHLEGQDARLVEFTVRDYKRAGLTLPDEKQQKVEALRKKLASIQTHFLVNANNAAAPLKFTRDELEGVSDDFLRQVKTGENEYTVDANVPPQYIYAMTNCVKEETRKRLCIARDTRAKEKNLPLATQAIEIRPVDAPAVYQDDVKLYAVLDQQSREPLGMFYLDLFPRPGKYNHFANFTLISGGLLPDGKYQRPVVDLICNFPPPTSDKPSLASQQDVVVIFHEFGHAMHAILTTVNYLQFSGTNVPGDFVEAPSQMLEYFAWDKKVLDSFAV